uniref:10 kDa chaperonin n=1 Tax=Ditylum brightwellii TaxID=49249 RepID=A0A6V2QIY9_9STRA|mmetsp:Transcript_47372/g.71724  ORF Transcript_47372/g.71724 Transcript_47372/m.71724 type:complete len:118 (+) Transcript_47372:289-642(+)
MLHLLLVLWVSEITTELKKALSRALAPLADRILIRRAAKEVQTAGGIYLPSDQTKNANQGTVVAVGPGIRDVSGVLHPPTLAEGDSVLLPEYGGTKVKIDDDELYLFREDDILGKFE